MKSNELRTYLCDHILTKGKDFLVTENNELVFRDVIVGVQKAEHLVFEKLQEIIGQEMPACGLCMNGVPCSFTNPVENNLTTN